MRRAPSTKSWFVCAVLASIAASSVSARADTSDGGAPLPPTTPAASTVGPASAPSASPAPSTSAASPAAPSASAPSASAPSASPAAPAAEPSSPPPAARPAPSTRASAPSGGPSDEPPPPIKRRAFDGSVPYGGDDLRKHLPELVWKREYARFGIANAILTGVGGATTLAMAIIPPIEGNRRSGGILFDEGARDFLRAPSFEGRYVARDSSDVLLSLATTYPFFVDALVSAWWFRGNADVARQMAFIDAEAMAITGTLQGVTNVLAARERPYGRTCGDETPEDSVDCTTTGRYRSFFSGHAAFTFTAAGLICSHHLELDLLGNKFADVASCVSAMLGAGAAATLRVVGDMHYASDVLLGAVVGTSVGIGVPWLHYHGFRTGGRVGGVDFHFVPNPSGGASLMGTF